MFHIPHTILLGWTYREEWYEWDM